jgi:dihydroorotase
MKILIKNGQVVDPSQGLSGAFDILIEGRIIRGLYPGGKAQKGLLGLRDRVIDAEGKYVVPGLVDMHVHLREPGFEYKETIKTGTRAAVRGGVTGVCAMPNTSPVNDNSGITEFIIRKAQKEGFCSVYPVGAITKGLGGEELAEMGMMKEEGCVAFSDDGRPVMNPLLMRRALEYAKAFDVPIISHSEDLNLSRGGSMNEGLLSQTMGLAGIPSAAEEAMIYRDVALAELTGGRLHVAHVSTRGSVSIIRQAKARGVRVTAETCPHYFSVTEDAVKGFNTNAKVNPPLRTPADVEAVKEGLRDDTIDVIATDHAPHHINEKLREFDQAPPGISGLETSLALSLALVEDGILTIERLVEKMSLNPSRILGLKSGTLKAGARADVTIIDLKKNFKVNSQSFISKGKNTPFDGWPLRGAAALTISGGKIYEWQE